jgi:hypothetical protein
VLKHPTGQPLHLGLSLRIRHLDARGEVVGAGLERTPADIALKVAGEVEQRGCEKDVDKERPWE